MTLEHFSMELKRVFRGSEVNAETWDELQDRYFQQQFRKKYLSGISRLSGIAESRKSLAGRQEEKKYFKENSR